MAKDGIEAARGEIDRIDREIGRLFDARMRAVRAIAAEKAEWGAPIRDPAREAVVLDEHIRDVEDPAVRGYYRALLREMMALSRAYQAEERAERSVIRDTRVPGNLQNDFSFSLRLPGGGYRVTLARGALTHVGEHFDLGRRVFILTDSGVPSAYAACVVTAAKESVTHVIPAGEASKNFSVLQEILGAMQAAGLTRGDALVAVGGGVVSDLGGLAAALYMRGIDFYTVPTTLLAQVDASVGGKTAVDFGGVKNAVGAFHQPAGVLIDPDVLSTLPPRQYANGMAEIIKMAATSDADLFADLETLTPGQMPPALLARALRVKTTIVERDPDEQGERRILNFGHTFGHAIESAAGGRLLHGEAVSLGMLPFASPAVRARLSALLARFGLPVCCDLPFDAAWQTFLQDKKRTGDRLLVVTVPAIGESRILPLTPDEAWARIREVYDE